MSELLTTKQLQELLKVDRTTVYRMLRTGRLNGVKVGNQWRFPREDVDKLLSGTVPSSVAAAPAAPADSPAPPTDILLMPCVQAIQDVFAEIANVGAVTTNAAGQPLTTVSNCSQFCQLIQSSETGRAACIKSWQKLAQQTAPQLHFVTCHAGLAYAFAGIEVNGKLEAILIAGQFYAVAPQPAARQREIAQLAQHFNLDVTQLAEAAADLSVLNQRMQASIGRWLAKVARSFGQVGKERAAFKDRLRIIAAMSTLDPT